MLLLLSSVPLTATAYDFMVDGIAYNINGDGTSVTVTSTVPDPADGGSYSGLTTANIPSSVTFNGNTYSVTFIDYQAFVNCSSLTSVTIGNSVISIGFAAFGGCSGLTSVTIGNSVTTIGFGAFSDCSGLTCITIPNSVTSIGISAFESCSGLTSVTIGNSVTSIGWSAFLGCSGLTSITIPNSVTSIDNDAFSGCNGLESIVVDNGNGTYDSRDNCNAIIETATNTLIAGCKNTVIPNSVTSIGFAAFADCSGLTSVTIPNSVTSIGEYAFSGCSGLTSLTLTGQGAWVPISNLPKTRIINIGSGVTSLGNLGFAPDVVNCYAEVPPTCSSSTFANYDGALHVPTTASTAYMTAEYWQNFTNLNIDIIEKITLNHNEATIVQHEGQQLTATVTSMVQNDEVLWCSTNAAVATVDDNGRVTAVDPGECYIIATLASNPAVCASCHITAIYPEITSLTLSETDLILNQLGDTLTLIATAVPDDTGVKPTWTSSDETVATVDANGLVTATGQGECDITATVLNQSATCHVTVNSTIVITLDQHEIELDLNHTAMLIPSCSPIETDLTVTSSDPSVVYARMVTQNGTAKVQLVGMKQGEATITVASVDGKAIPDSCVVTVVRRVGDLNADGYINVMDITTLIELIMGNVDAPDDAEMPYCDVKADGEINVMDITALIDIIMNS